MRDADQTRKMAARPTVLLSALIFCLYGCHAARGECSNVTLLSTQVDTLLAEYDRDAAPAQRVLVTLALDVRHAAVDEPRAVMRLLADLKMSWQEPRVKWNASEWGCGTALTAVERLWRPDIELLNAAATNLGDAGLRARLDAVGAVYWISRLDVTVPLDLALHDWPSDVQSCTFKFGSRIYNDDELVLDISEFKHAVVFEAGAWEIQSVSGAAGAWRRGDADVSTAAWTVRVSRRAPAHALAAATVLVAAALLLLAAAALPPLQRPPLAAAASFIAALWMITTLVRLPGSSSSPRALAVMCGVCVCGALSGACAALVLRVARLGTPPPQALRTLLSSLSTVCKLTPSPESCGSSESGAWAALARLLDRALSAALLLTLFVLLAVQLF
ncbi:acetylcholine receptor subunit beta-type lev-1 [Helicoverpa armigera]|uniref:acetylcholine receptor subunit beta-type lev-1 n=1 Tax=Helicoverpa armigera TaxID=29058 RepID=UPI003082E5C7